MLSSSFKPLPEAATLVDVLQMAPTLLQSLLPADLGAVSSTSRQLRCLVHEHATKITIIRHYWDKSYDTRCPITELQALSNGGWPRLQCLNLKYRADLGADAIRNLNTASWSRLASLDLSRNSIGTDAMSQLVLGKWPALKHLDLSYSDLRSAAIVLLSKADWPLEVLNLSGNKIDVEGMKELVQGSWPSLTQLSLQQNYLDVDAMKVLAKAPWPLQRLDLRDSVLLKLIPKDEALAMAEAASGKWPDMQELKLAGNTLNAQVIATLCQADWPNLVSLDLSKCSLYGSDIAGLCQAHWPRLSNLDLTGNQLNELSMTHLVKNSWPVLKYLWLGGNSLDEAAVKILLCGTWHKLEFLDCKFNFRLTQNAASLLKNEHRFAADC